MKASQRISLELGSIFTPQMLVKIAIQLLLIRFIVRLMDFEESKQQNQEADTWVFLILTQTTCSRLCIEQYFYNCMAHTILNKLLGFTYIFIFFLTLVLNGSITVPFLDAENKIEIELGLYLLCFIFGFAYWLYLLNQAHADHIKYLHDIYRSISSQSDQNTIINRLDESIIIIHENLDQKLTEGQYQIAFVNDDFLD